jgi:hypothetical protein
MLKKYILIELISDYISYHNTSERKKEKDQGVDLHLEAHKDTV